MGNLPFIQAYAHGQPQANTVSGGTINLAAGVAGVWRQFNVEASRTAALAGQPDMTISSAITGGSGANGIDKLWGGTTLLSGVNTYSGATRIEEGRLQISSGNAIPSASSVLLFHNDADDQIAVFDVNNATATIGSLYSYGNWNNGGYNLLALGSSGNLTVGGDNTSSTTLLNGTTNYYDGLITGGSASVLTKVGTGTMTLQGPSSWGMTGTINDNGGTLIMNRANTMPYLAALTVGSGGTFNINSFNTVIGALQGSGLVTNLSATTSSAMLTVGDNGASTVFSGQLSGGTALSITKIGAGVLTLTPSAGTNAAGSLVIDGGSVVITGAASAPIGFADTVNSTGVLSVNDAGGTVANRLGNGNPLTLAGGTFSLVGGGDAAATETVGAVALNSGLSAIALTPGSGTAATFTGASLARGVGGMVVFSGGSLGSATGANVANILFTAVPTVVGTSGTAGTTTMGILPYALVDTTAGGSGAAGFATYGTNGIRPLAVGEYVTDALTANANVQLGAGGVQNSAGASINSLTLNNNGGVAMVASTGALNILSGGIQAFAGNAGISGGTLASANELDVYSMSGATLNLNSLIAGSGGLTTGGPGVIALGQQVVNTGTITVNSGLLSLASGADNTLAVINGNPPALVVNGGTLNLGSNNQTAALGSNNNPLTGTGGTITGGTAATFVSSNLYNATFSGNIAGGMNFRKTGVNTLTLTGPSSYTGATTVNNGTLVLQDGGRLTGTSGVTVNYAAVNLDNRGLDNRSDRLPGNLVTLSGGTLNFYGAQGAVSTETLTNVAIPGGAAAITANATATSLGNADLTITNLVRNAGGGTVNFGGTGLGAYYSDPYSTQLGAGTLRNGAHILINDIDGSAPTLTNNILAGWATINGTDFATYNSATGIAVLGAATGAGAYFTAGMQYSSSQDNLSLGAQPWLNISGRTINSLRINAGVVVPMTSSSTLALGSGGLLVNNQTAWIENGQITAGASPAAAELDAFINQNTTTITSTITDNAFGGAVSLVKSGLGNLALTAQNTNSGPTVVNQGVLNLTGTGLTLSSAAGLTINNAAINETSRPGQFAPSNNLTMNGGGLGLLGNNGLGQPDAQFHGRQRRPQRQHRGLRQPAGHLDRQRQHHGQQYRRAGHPPYDQRRQPGPQPGQHDHRQRQRRDGHDDRVGNR